MRKLRNNQRKVPITNPKPQKSRRPMINQPMTVESADFMSGAYAQGVSELFAPRWSQGAAGFWVRPVAEAATVRTQKGCVARGLSRR